MRYATNALPGPSLQHVRSGAASCGIAFLALMATSTVAAQVTTTRATVELDQKQQAPGGCAAFANALTMTGVQYDGASHPGRCRHTVVQLLFNGVPLPTTFNAYLASPAKATFQRQVSPEKGRVCMTATKLKFVLSATIQSLRLMATDSPAVGGACTIELNHVSDASAAPPSLAASVNSFLNKFAQDLAPVTATGCGIDDKAAETALQQKIWTLLSQAETMEGRRLGSITATADDGSRCAAPQCSICSPGWAGRITCHKQVADANYVYNEDQNWAVGGIAPVQTGGSTTYSTIWSLSGSGTKNGNLPISASASDNGTLAVTPKPTVITFETSQLSGPKETNDIHVGNVSFSESEFQNSNTAPPGSTQVPPPPPPPPPVIYGYLITPAGKLPYICGPAQQTGSCQVTCNWALFLQ